MRLSSNGFLKAFAFTAAYSTRSVLGWGSVGHEIAATIAQVHLHPSVLPNICGILHFHADDPNSEPLCHLAPIAAWADKIRFKMRWSAGLHYVGGLGDHPPDLCVFPGERGWAGRQDVNVLGGIRNTTNILIEWRDRDEELANEALKFLVHFLGDLHMPLHLTGRDRGGNGDKVLFDGRQTNLHSLWDSLLISKSLRTISRNYTVPLPISQVEFNLRKTIYDPYVRRVMYEGVLGRWKEEIPSWFDCPQDSPDDNQEILGLQHDDGGARTDDALVCPFYWAQPIHTLNCAFIWPKELDELNLSSSSDLDSSISHSYDSTDSLISSFDIHGKYIGGRKPSPKERNSYLELDTPQYAGYIAREWIIEKLLAQAGIRMAGILNWLFADDDEISFARSQTRDIKGPWIVDVSSD